jgi:serpin B
MQAHIHAARALRAAAVLLVAVTGCGKEAAGPGLEPPRNLTVDEQTVSAANTAFGLGLLRELHPAETKPNLFVSPLSASMALGMTLNGARAETETAMRRALGFEGLSAAGINAAYGGLIAQLRARDPGVEFRLANSIWHERTFTVEAPFLEAARTHFDAEVRGLDFSAPDAPRIISGWAEDATGGRIKDLIQSIDPLEKLFLVNAVYFKAPWTTPFEPAATRDGPFQRAGGGTVQVPLMTTDATFRSFRDADVEAVELLYADSAFSMVVLMPAQGRTLDGLVASLTPERWARWMDAFTPGRLMLTLPKFRFDYARRLNDALTGLGMGIAFVPRRADFSGISRERDDLYISRVEHKTFVDVHELGTEAAAATAVGIGVTSLPPSLRFDRPFLFAIRERSTGTILFLGRIGDPSVR